MKKIIVAKELTKSYDGIHNILSDVNIEIEEGSKNLIIGESGCGKTTLLSILEAIEKPDSGVLTIKDYDVYGMKSKELTKFRGENIGVVFQNYQLIQELTAIDNIKLPAVINKKNINEKYLKWLIKALNIKHCIKRYPDELSGGEQQRVILARALAQKPKCLILDEPTNHLDIKYQLQLMRIVKSLNIEVIAAIHDLNIAAMYCDKIYVLKDGKIVKCGKTNEVLTKKLIKDVYEVDADVIVNQGMVHISYIS